MNEVNYLIISSTLDYSTDLICIELEKQEMNYLRINRDCFTEYNIIYDIQSDILEVEVGKKSYLISSKTLKSIFFRAPIFIRPTGKSMTLKEQLVLSQWNAFIRNLITFDRVFWINHPVNTYRAENKMYQLKVAKRIGLDIPDTYIGNCLPQMVEAENEYIVKSLDTALFYDEGKEMFTYSTMVTGKELMNSELKDAPIIIQNFLSKKIDIRVTIVEDQIFTTKITKQGSAIFSDWRTTNKELLEYSTTKLPYEIEIKLFDLMKSLRLTIGGIDLALVGNKFYFIEVNPTGEWGWLVTDPKFPIDKAIVYSMINGGNYGENI